MSYYKHEGYKIYYKIDGEGEPLLMIHGSTASSLMLKEEVDFYSKYFKVIIVDIIGHGNSERLEEFPVDFWNENTVILRRLCNYLDLNKINILGTSGGAIIALNFALNYPEITHRVIADSFIGEEFSIEEAKALKEEREYAKMNGANEYWNYMHGKEWEKVIDADTKMLIKYAKKFGNNFQGNLDKINCY